MKTVKMLAAAVIMAASFSAPVLAQQPKAAKEAKLKDHKCTAACTKDKHAYAHGEKGHVCTAACKKETNKKA